MLTQAPVDAAKALFALVSTPAAGAPRSQDDWLEILGDAQSAINVLSAVQAVAMAQVAAFDSEEGHGIGPQQHRGLGHQALDAPDLVATRLGCCSQSAAARLGTALAQVTTMPALVEAMARGELDSFRAAVVADELDDAGPETRAVVVEGLAAAGHLVAESAGPLRRRARRLLGAVDPDVLDARVASARQRRGLFRATEHAGLDHWEGWLPVESSRPAWAAVTGLAQDYLRAGRADSLATARADALADLILGHSTGTFVLHPTISAAYLMDTRPGNPTDRPAVTMPMTGFGAPGETLVRRDWLRALADVPRRRRGRASTAPVVARVGEAVVVDDVTGAVLAPAEGTSATRGDTPDHTASAGAGTVGYRPPAALERLVRMRDGGCRFPGCSVPARFCDLDHVIAYDHDDPARGGPTATCNLACLCRRHHRIKQRPGWTAVLHPDGTMTWTDPSGRSRLSWPLDHRATRRPPARSTPLPDQDEGFVTAPAHEAVLTDECLVAAPVQDAVLTDELEPFSQLEDELEAWLAEATGTPPASTHNSTHRTAPAPRHGRRAGRSTERRRTRCVDIVVEPRLDGRPWAVSDATLAEWAAAAEARTAPPF